MTGETALTMENEKQAISNLMTMKEDKLISLLSETNQGLDESEEIAMMEINLSGEKLEECKRITFRRALWFGLMLRVCKKRFGQHTEWKKWHTQHVPERSERQLQKYMRLAKNLKLVEKCKSMNEADQLIRVGECKAVSKLVVTIREEEEKLFKVRLAAVQLHYFAHTGQQCSESKAIMESVKIAAQMIEERRNRR